MKVAQEQRVQFGLSLAYTNFSISTLYTNFWNIRRLGKTAQEAGYDDLEWHPVKNTIAGLQIKFGIGRRTKEFTNEYIGSLHQSWREETEFWQAIFKDPRKFLRTRNRKDLFHDNPKLAIPSYFFLPHQNDSLQDMQQIDSMTERKLSTVLYPNDTTEAFIANNEKTFGEKLFQPTKSIMTKWKVHSVQELIAEAKRRKYTGFTLDLFHMRQTDTEGLDGNHWSIALKELLPFTKEIHVAAGRIDFKRDIDTMNELRDLYHRSDNSELPKILTQVGKFIEETGWSGRIVVEIPSSALHTIMKEGKRRGLILSRKDFIAGHQKVLKTIRELLNLTNVNN